MKKTKEEIHNHYMLGFQTIAIGVSSVLGFGRLDVSKLSKPQKPKSKIVQKNIVPNSKTSIWFSTEKDVDFMITRLERIKKMMSIPDKKPKKKAKKK